MRIVLVRLRLIGDVVFTTPVVRALRERYPDAHLSYVVEPLAEAVVADNPHLDEVIVAPRRRGMARLRDDVQMAARLRQERFDIAIDLHGGPRSAWLTWATGARMRIGYRIPGRAWMYTHVVDRSPDLRPRHSVENQFDVLAPLGLTACDPRRLPVEMGENPAAAARAAVRMREAGLLPEHDLIVVHVSAGNPFRRWPESQFADLAVRLLSASPARRIVLTAGPSDAAAAARIDEMVRRRITRPDQGPIVADWPLAELRALITRAAVYIGGDSGPAHMAATTTTSIVELLGPTLPERSRPWRDPRWFAETVDAGALPCRPCHQRHCDPGDFRCLTRISADTVAAAAERALAHPRTV